MHIEAFEAHATALVVQFGDNEVFRRIDCSAFTMADYHRLLIMLFHQVNTSANSFAIAAANLPPELWPAKNYLFHHADEEKTHWQWILNDLRATHYDGESPQQLFLKPACAAYVAYNFYVAHRMPLCRLAIAMVLEGIGATHSKPYVAKLARDLDLKPQQAQFFLGHSDTDVRHTAEIIEVLRRCELTGGQWDEMADTASTALVLYRAMYDEALAT